MDKIIIFNTAISSLNMGDYIISKSCKNELKKILKNKFAIELTTHTPVTHFYQNLNCNKLIKFCNESKYKFILGTNLLAYNMVRPWPNFNINIFNTKPYNNCILVGCGLNPNKSSCNFYTRFLYKKILSKDYIHSVRDENTKIFLESLGYKAINTGCATMWKFTKSFCEKIKKSKSNSVVFTLTDYCKDIVQDQKLIDILNKDYKNIYFWVQGSDDYEYLKSFNNIEKIKIIDPKLDEYENILNTDVDYVGTRLHAGIYAMQHMKRTIIIAIDNRTRDINETYNLNVIERCNIDNELEEKINSNFDTKINIKEDNIKFWKNQFKE